MDRDREGLDDGRADEARLLEVVNSWILRQTERGAYNRITKKRSVQADTEIWSIYSIVPTSPPPRTCSNTKSTFILGISAIAIQSQLLITLLHARMHLENVNESDIRIVSQSLSIPSLSVTASGTYFTQLYYCCSTHLHATPIRSVISHGERQERRKEGGRSIVNEM